MGLRNDTHGTSEGGELTATLVRLAENVAALLREPCVSICLLDAETGDAVTRAALGAAQHRPARFRPNVSIEGWVAAHLEPLHLPDLDNQSRFPDLYLPGVRSVVCIPLLDADHLLGTLLVGSTEPGALDAERQALLHIFADQAVLAISSSLQAEASRQQARELAALLEASRALTSSLDQEQVLAFVVASMRKVIPCEDALLSVYEPQTASLRVVAGVARHGTQHIEGTRISLSDSRSIAAWVALHRRARLTSPRDRSMGVVTEALLSGEEMSVLCVPLVSKDQLRGVAMLVRPQPFSSNELATMLNLSNIIAATLENVALYQTAQAEREQQSAIYASASDCIAIVDAGLTLVEANQAFARLIGEPSEQLRGQSACAVLGHNSVHTCRLCDGDCMLAQALQSGESVEHVECEFLQLAPQRRSRSRVSGGRIPRRYIDFSITPIQEGATTRVLLVGRDVSAQREMEVLKANFLSMVSHELRTPLQTITGYLDLTLAGAAGSMDQQLGEFVRRARAGSEHLTALVDDLLLISRRDAGQFIMRPSLTELDEVIQDAVEELELVAEDAGVHLHLMPLPPLPPLLADAPRMRQVLRNLLTNAIKFTPPGGDVRVEVELTDEELLIRVQDSGIGIAPEHQAYIFDRFYQVDDTPVQGRLHGQGLGLAIVRIIMEGHGGTVEVQSQPQRGSTFTVHLPRSARAGVESRPK